MPQDSGVRLGPRGDDRGLVANSQTQALARTGVRPNQWMPLARSTLTQRETVTCSDRSNRPPTATTLKKPGNLGSLALPKSALPKSALSTAHEKPPAIELDHGRLSL